MAMKSTWKGRTALSFAATTLVVMIGCSSSSKPTIVRTDDGAGRDGGSPAPDSGPGKPHSMSDGALILGPGSVVRDGGGPDASCGNTTLAATPPNVNVLLVIDESGSMTDEPPGFGVDKWTAMKSALRTSLGAASPSIAFGLELFPAAADPKKPIPLDCAGNCCEMPASPGITVPITAKSPGTRAIETALDASVAAGGTPTAEALRRALEYFTTGAGKSLTGDRYVLLATDGGPDCDSTLSCTAQECTTNLDGDCPLPNGQSCCDPQFGGASARSRCLDASGTGAQIKALRAAGVRTFVVGIPGSEAYANALDGFAVAGGEATSSGSHKYFAVEAAGGIGALSGALETITKGVIMTCRLVLGSQPPDIHKLNVTVDGEPVPQAGPDGWEVDTSVSPPAVVLKGATCADIEANGAQRLKVQYGCPTLLTR
jgi:hypothetical protein